MIPSCTSRTTASRPNPQTYGKHESATNEVWLKDFDVYLKQHHNSSVEALAGQWRSIIKETLDAAREFMEVDKFEPPYNCFRCSGSTSWSTARSRSGSSR